ncbi:MAG TPA: DoxX family protein [Gemmatimonadales bacterium]|nr:DoxX family protein [Gemmatimonadales bacterium]
MVFLIGRVLYGGFFVISGARHFINLKSMSAYASSRGVPVPQAAVLGSGLIAVLGGLSIMLGALPTVGIILLVMFLIPVSLMVHNYWADTDPAARQANQIHFMKNVGLLGGALMLSAIPAPWGWSVLP